MKVRIKSFNGELPEYLTVGKVYEVVTPMSYLGLAQYTLMTIVCVTFNYLVKA